MYSISILSTTILFYTHRVLTLSKFHTKAVIDNYIGNNNVAHSVNRNTAKQ